jgi:hypothetical protein
MRAALNTFPLESTDTNPYAPPTTVSDAPLRIREALIRTPWLRCFIVIQAILIVIALAFEAYMHESIVCSGPIFSLFGLVIAILAFRNRDHIAAFFGCSAIVFTLLIVFLINYNSWGPPQGDLPITIMSFTYAVLALPVSLHLVFARSKSV